MFLKMIEIVRGDILLANTAEICHEVNCQILMGSGVAKAISTKWPEVKLEYHEFCSGKRPRRQDLFGLSDGHSVCRGAGKLLLACVLRFA